MKTMNSTIHSRSKVRAEGRERVLPVMMDGSKQALALLSAVTTATALVFLGIWISGFEAPHFVGAAIWAMGFVFLGIAVDKRGLVAIAHLVSGLTMLLLAWLQSTVSADFTMVSGVVLAAWASVLVFRQLR